MAQDLSQELSQSSSQALSHVRIVLLEPAGPLNIGSVARVMKNMGLSRLVLVNPQCDPLGEEARQMAVHAADVLEGAQRVDTLVDALRGCLRAVATTGRDRALPNTALESPRTCLPWLLDPIVNLPQDNMPQGAAPPAALIFGREDRGLNNEELNYAQRFIRIPSHPAYPSLNLAQAVAICCYELYEAVQQAAAIEESGKDTEELGEGQELRKPSSLPSALSTSISISISTSASTSASMLSAFDPPATLDRVEGYYQQLEALLLQIGYLYPHTASSRMEKFRRLFNRAYLTDAEVAMLRGILRQVQWALQQASLGNADRRRP